MNSVPLESTFCETLLDGSSFPQCLCIGNKGSGKTFFALKVVRFLLESPKSPYKKFHIVSPVAKFEQSDSYAFLKDWGVEAKRDKVVYMYPTYKSSLAQAIVMRKTTAEEGEDPPCPLFVMIDDMAAGSADNIKKCPYLPDLCCTSRHRKTTLFFISHSLTAAVGGNTGLLSPWVRQTAAYVIAMRCNSASLVQQVFDEYISLISLTNGGEQKEGGEGDQEPEQQKTNAYLAFASAFNRHTMGVLKGTTYVMSHKGICINASGGLLDDSVREWLQGYECDRASKGTKRKNVSLVEKDGDTELPGDEPAAKR